MRLRFFVIDRNGGVPLPGRTVRAIFELGTGKGAGRNDGKHDAVELKKNVGKSKDGSQASSALLSLIGQTFDKLAGTAGAAEIVVGSTRTDREGYGRIDIPADDDAIATATGLLLLLAATGEIDFRLVVDGDPSAETGILDNGLIHLLGLSNVETLLANQQLVSGLLEKLEHLLDKDRRSFVLHADSGTLRQPEGRVEDPDPLDYAASPGSFVARRDIKTGDGADGCEHITPARLPLRSYPIYHVVVYDQTDKAGAETLPSVTAEPPIDNRVRWGRIYEFEQSWTSLGHSLGEVKYSLALAPGEAVKVAVVDWRRDDAASRLGTNASKDELAHEQAVDRDIEDIVNGKVSEQQSGESFMAGLAGAMDFTIPQYGISAAGRHSIGFGMSATRGSRDVSADAQQNVHLKTVQRTNLARSQNSSVVVQATQAEANNMSTRIVANMNRGHALTILYYEVLRHLAVRTEYRKADPAVLIPVQPIRFDKDLALRYRAQLEPQLPDRKYALGFDAIERMNAGLSETAAPAPKQEPIIAPQPVATGTTAVFATQFEVKLKTGWRWRSNAYGAPPDLGGSFQVVARLDDGTDVEIARLDYMPVATEQFRHIFNIRNLGLGSTLGNNGNWAISFDQDKNPGLCFATFTSNVSPIELTKLQSFAVKWQPAPWPATGFDGWNLLEAQVTPMLSSGPLLLGQYVYPLTTGERFGNGSDGQRTTNNNQGIPLVNTDKLKPPASPSATSGTSPPSPSPGAPPNAANSVTNRPDDVKLADLLVQHLNANRYFYSAAVWLGMDPRERRLRIAQFAGPLMAGMSEQPFAMSGNHLAFRYSGELPSGVAATLPAPETKLKPRENVVTLPTRGIFAEAHLGHCNAAEKRDVTRLWNFDELPVSLLPNIDTLTAGPRGGTPTLSADSMGPTSLGVAATPTLPGPGEAIADALKLLATPDIFRDQSTREQVAEIMGKLIESAQPPKLTGEGIGSGFGGGKNGGTASNRGLSAPPMVPPNPSGSSPDEWANPFPDRSQEDQQGQSFLAERYGNHRLTDDTDRLKLAPELAQNLIGSGLSRETVEEIVSRYCKGTTTTVKRNPAPSARGSLPIRLKTQVSVQNGVTRALNGDFEITFSPPGDQFESPSTSLRMPVRQGANTKRLALPVDSYTVRARYFASNPADLAVLQEPQRDSLGLNGKRLVELAIDLLQQDLAGQMTLDTEIQGDNVTITSKTQFVDLAIEAMIEQSTQAAFDVEFSLGTEFTLDSSGKLSFNTGKIGDLASALAAKLKIKQAALVAGLLSVFTIESNIGFDNKLKTGGSGKAVFKFTPCYLKALPLTATPS